jgi:hypothetical protein
MYVYETLTGNFAIGLGTYDASFLDYMNRFPAAKTLFEAEYPSQAQAEDAVAKIDRLLAKAGGR